MKRIYEQLARDHFAHNRQMVFFSGPRQVGKTTLAKASVEGARYLNYDNVDDALVLAKGVSAISGALNLNEPARAASAVIFDEIHKYAKWKRLLKGFFDSCGEGLKIIATGSARMDVYKRGGDSMMGRYFAYRVHPLTIAELASPEVDLETDIQRPRDLAGVDVARLLAFGGYPEPFLNGTPRFLNRWRSARLDKIFSEDVRDLSRVQDLRGVRSLAALLEARVCGEINHVALGRDLGVSSETVKKWIALLESVYYCYEIRPYFRNVANSIRKAPKIYLWDWSSIFDEGARAENFVASHLLKAVQWWTDSGLGAYDLCYIRDKQGHEVDFVVVKDGQPFMLVEAKRSSDAELSGSLKSFASKLSVRYAFQVAVEEPPSTINPLDYAGRPVKIAFADLAKVLI